MFICICNAITEHQVLAAVADGSHTFGDLQASTGVGTCCGRCVETAEEYLPGGRYAATHHTNKQGATVGDAANDEVVMPYEHVAAFQALEVHRVPLVAKQA